MSIPVPLERLRAAIDERGGTAYVLTVSAEATPHAVHGRVRWEGDALAMEVGKRTAANAAARPAVSLLYPVRSADDYSLIVDGTGDGFAAVRGQPVEVVGMRHVALLQLAILADLGRRTCRLEQRVAFARLGAELLCGEHGSPSRRRERDPLSAAGVLGFA